MVDQFGNWRPDYPGQQPYMDPQFVRMYGQQMQQPAQPQAAQAQQQQATPQTMTPPTIHAEIVQVDGEQAAAQYPVGAGASQMMMARDESAIFVKEATQNGYRMIIYDRRPEAPPAPPFNPADFVRLDELPNLVAAQVQAAVAAAISAKQTRGKKEAEAAE